MKYETEFLKYLDKELSKEEAKDIEDLLRNDQEQRKIFETIKAKRNETLNLLSSLNPQDEIAIPSFELNKQPLQNKAKKYLFLRPVFWRYAALILVLAAFIFGFWFVEFQATKPHIADDSEIKNTLEYSHEFEKLNYYISPNRCWHNRQMVGSFTESKFKNEIL